MRSLRKFWPSMLVFVVLVFALSSCVPNVTGIDCLRWSMLGLKWPGCP